MSNKNDKNNDTSIKIDRRKLLVSGATGAVALGLEGCKLNKTSTVKENRGTTQEAKGKRIKEAAKKNYQESCKALIGQEKLSKSRKENKADWKKLLSTVHDIVIIGSGYGASCAAANLSEALKNKGKSIVVLERGKEWIPGDFPDNSTDLLTEANIHDGREITETFVRAGLFNIHRGENINIVTASGLGGTSLINAGIAIEPKKEVFASSEWAGIWGKNPEDRNKYFKRARNALGVNKTPKFLREDSEKNVKYSRKVEAIQNPRGNKLEDNYNMLDITINDGYQAEKYGFTPKFIHENGCIGCGDCFTGCNVGAKRSVNTTYLATAAANGAQIWTDTHVKKISHKNSNKESYYKIHIHEAGSDATLKSKLVIVAAGTMGTNNILMNSQGNDEEALDLSKNIGQHFSANGDVIGFGFTKERRLNGGGPGLDNLNNHNRVGAVVESIVDDRNGVDIYNHIAAVDACIPSAVSAPITGSIRGVRDFTAKLKADANTILKIFINNDGKEEIPEDDLAGFDKFFTFLVLNHDQSIGKLTKGPEKGYAKPEFPEYGQQPEGRNFIDKSNELMTKIMKAMGGKFIPGGPNSSVHPLGGVRMSADHNRGGCDLSGRVYKSQGGETNPGLFVCDASVMPMSTGIHPFLTISALAEKISEQIINSDEFKQILNS